MMKMDGKQPTWFDWTAQNLSKGAKIGIDFTQYPAGPLETRTKFFEEKEMTVVEVKNLVDLVWEKDGRPPRPQNPVFHLEAKYNGKPTAQKFE
jgi:Xaa-Pro aminopeptidase